MKDIKDFYILGLPIETEIGVCDFIKVKEYPDYFFDLQVLSWSKLKVIFKYTEINKNGELDELISQLNDMSLFEIVANIPDLRQSYFEILSKVFGNEESLNLINEKNFNYYRQLILEMNCLKEEKINPNPEIQAWIEKSKRVKQQESGELTFADIVSSVVGYNGLSYKEINNMTIYQLYMTFHRIGQIKGYDTQTLFATVSSEKISIESWCKHIDLLAEEKHGISRGEFKNKANSIFG